ncbi:MAG TPA: L-lactate dehydrogenase [Anaerolineaceae bacterium]|nr:L-lactate dehydrogenase [Anaerolineaceae bacterium]
MDNLWRSRKVVIVGAGAVGSTFAYALAQKGLAQQICLIDANPDFAEGQALDLAHGLPFYPSVQIRAGDSRDYSDAQVIVITAGAKQAPGESRLNLLQKNAAIVEEIVDEIVAQKSQAVLIVATNPVDILTHVALKHSGWAKNRVIGSGTVLDSARFRYIISQHCNVDVGNVHAYILGEHGDSEVAAWSMTHVAGMPIGNYCLQCNNCSDWHGERDRIVRAVRDSAYHIINYKGSTYFGIGMSLARIVGTILQDQNSVLTVSTYLEGEYGLNAVCLSVPCVVGQGGVKRIVQAELYPEEQSALERSAQILKDGIASLKQAGTS